MKAKITSYIAVLALVVAMAVSAAAFVAAPAQSVVTAYAADGSMQVHFIDCGQADACFIDLPDGKNILIDTGHTSSSSWKSVVDYLDGLGVSTIDYMILTHSDADHIGGATHILEEYEVKTIYRPAQACSRESGNEYCTDPAYSLSAADGTGFYADPVAYKDKSFKTYSDTISAVYAETYTENGQKKNATVYVTNPFNDKINSIEGESFDYSLNFYSPIDVTELSDNNDFSPIMVLSYASRDFVLTGDAEKQNEEDFVRFVRDEAQLGDYGGRYDKFIKSEFTADVIKMGHHGSSTSSGEDFLEIMTANAEKRPNVFTIFSCGDGNSYGHPHVETLKRLMDMGFSAERIERTDLNGDIVFGVSAEGALALREERSDVTIEQKLTTGSGNSSRPQETIKDNDKDPSEAIDALPDSAPAQSGIPDLFDPKSWARNPAEWHPLQWVIVAVILVVVVAAIAVAINKAKKKRK